MSIDTAVSRRGILVAGAGVAGVAVLAACSSGSSDSADTKTSDAASSPSSAPTTATTAEAPTSASQAAPAASKDLVALAAVPVGSSKVVTLADGKPGIVTRTGTATAVCFSAACTHMGCPVAPKGGVLLCPCHGSTFNTKTGAVLGGPAPAPLPKIAVTVAGGKVTEA